jgi:NAD+ kinase
VADTADATVVDSFEQSRYEIILGGEVAGVLHYRRHGAGIDLMHTEIDQAFEGRGLAGRLASGALEDARARSTPVVVTCPFVSSYVERHPEYADIVTATSPQRTTA